MVWNCNDVLPGLMAFFNIVALFTLSGVAYRITKKYFSTEQETPESRSLLMTSHSFPHVTLIEHPVISRDLTILRDKGTSTANFRLALKRIGVILAYHALKELPLKEFSIQTPIKETTGYDIDQQIIVVPILRAGLGLIDALIDFIPGAKVGHLGMYRDEQTHEPVDYYSSIPEGIKEAMVLVVDPMLATGGSADDALSFLKKQGAQHLRFVSLISAPEGLKRLQENHPDVQVITSAIDEKLNDDAFIVPGLGDAGDRYFGTT